MAKDESCHEIVAQMASRLAQPILPRYSHPKRPYCYTLTQ